AVIFRDDQFSYQTINAEANRLAHRLKTAGVEPEVPVGLVLERGPGMIIGLLGILKAGGAYVPYDPAYPRGRLGRIIDAANVRVLVTRREFLASFPVEKCAVICVDENFDAADFDENPVTRTVPDNIAYIIYTSGSTGRPKGVMVRHGSAINLAAALR